MDTVLAQTRAVSESGATEFLANLSVGMIGAIALALTVLRLLFLMPRGNGAPNPMAKGIAEIFESFLVALVLVFLIIRPFFLQAFFIPSESMEPTLMGHNAGGEHTDTIHDNIFVNKLVYRYGEPQFGDIIVFRAPAKADQESERSGKPQVENVLIKRLIGLPGDTIEVKDVEKDINGEKRTVKAVFRNNKQIADPYIKEPMESPGGGEFGLNAPLKLGENQLFVMGDNRNDSNDSRFWGTLERARVIGKASFIFWPMGRLRLLH